MYRITTGTKTTNNDKKPTEKEIIIYVSIMNELNLHNVLYIENFKVTKAELVYYKFDREKIMKCILIAREFEKKYPKFKYSPL